jgi:hypothetical protein
MPSHSIPTPTASDHIERKNTTGVLNPETNKAVSLDRWVRFWPTPHANCHTGAGEHGEGGPNLQTAVKMWPTPSASDNRDRGNRSTPAIKRRIEKGKQVMLSMSVSDTSGALNPTWVEWLMGFPLGWTDLKPSETP